MAQEDSSAEYEQPFEPGIDSERCSVILIFLKDYPGINNQVRKDLLKKYEEATKKKEAILEPKKAVEEAIKKDFVRSGADEDDQFEFNFAPYDEMTGERLPMPGAGVSVVAPVKVDARDYQTYPVRRQEMFFPNEKAYIQFEQMPTKGNFPPPNMGGAKRLPDNRPT